MIIRHAQRRRFTTIDRDALNDGRLSFRARGVLAWLLDKPDSWECRSQAIAEAGTEGRDAIRSALRELEEHRYLRWEKRQVEGGLWVTETWIYEQPGPENPASGLEIRSLENRTSDSQALSSSLLKTNTEAPHGAEAPSGRNGSKTEKRGSRIPDPFTVTAEMAGWVESECRDIDWRVQTANFVDYFKSQPGRGGVKLEWPRVWKKWMRTAQDRVPQWQRSRAQR